MWAKKNAPYSEGKIFENFMELLGFWVFGLLMNLKITPYPKNSIPLRSKSINSSLTKVILASVYSINIAPHL